jgi:hypothetical protein
MFRPRSDSSSAFPSSAAAERRACPAPLDTAFHAAERAQLAGSTHGRPPYLTAAAGAASAKDDYADEDVSEEPEAEAGHQQAPAKPPNRGGVSLPTPPANGAQFFSGEDDEFWDAVTMLATD